MVFIYVQFQNANLLLTVQLGYIWHKIYPVEEKNSTKNLSVNAIKQFVKM